MGFILPNGKILIQDNKVILDGNTLQTSLRQVYKTTVTDLTDGLIIQLPSTLYTYSLLCTQCSITMPDRGSTSGIICSVDLKFNENVYQQISYGWRNSTAVQTNIMYLYPNHTIFSIDSFHSEFEWNNDTISNVQSLTVLRNSFYSIKPISFSLTLFLA